MLFGVYVYGEKAWLMGVLTMGEFTISDELVKQLARQCADIALDFGLPAGVELTAAPDGSAVGVAFVLDTDPHADDEKVEALARQVEDALFSSTAMDRASCEVTLGVGMLLDR